MGIGYQRLLGEEPRALHYRSMRPGAVDELLASATGCVLGDIACRPYIDVIVGMVPHRLEFDADAELRQVVSRARAIGIPIHRDVEMLAVLVATYALTVAAVAYAIWLGL